MKKNITILSFLFLLISLDAFCQTNNSKNDELISKRQMFWDSLPKPQNWTSDYENILTENEEQQLNNKIINFKYDNSIEFAVVSIDTSLVSYDKFEDLSLHIFKTWRIGDQDKNNGILIAFSKGYRKIRIQNGSGITKLITDKETKEIIDNYFIPSFKKGNYYEGIDKGLTEMVKILKEKAICPNPISLPLEQDFKYSIDRPIEGQLYTAKRLKNFMAEKKYEEAINLFSKKEQANIRKVKSENEEIFFYWRYGWALCREGEYEHYCAQIRKGNSHFVFEDGEWKIDEK